jgi:hypothetical protein
MTGKPFYKTRTITSERLVSPLAGRRDLNDAAIAFKKAVLESITRPTLNAGLSVKALDSATGNETYKDTDGKKRTSKGGTPGMVERLNGYNYLPGQKWEEGKILNLFPSVKLRNTAVKKPNFGWVDEPRSVSADEYARILAAKPKLRIRKYRVNPKTDEIIEESEQTLDPFSLNGDKTVNSSGYAEKRLPGKTIGQRGRSLIARAASAFGIIVDENGKFRCPPGTPAANQFTDNAGTNCFGISASEIFDFAKRMASGIDVSKETGVKHTTKKLFEFISWLDNGAIPGIGRTVWRDENGKRIKNIKKWREASLNDSNSRVFVDGMIRAQDKLAQQDINIASLMDTLGVIRTDERKKTNEDVFEVFQKLRDSGAWTIDTSSRLSAEDIDKIVKARLAHVPGFSDLTPERQKSLIAADTERWYTTERALLESALDSFIADPEHMRTIASINFQVKSPDDPRMDEASTGGFTSPDSKRVMSVIYVDIPEIMNNQEAMIPSLAPGERMRIDFVGGKTDSERATALTDFLVTVDGHSKQLAAMVEERAFARHIMKHEIAHTIQMQAFNREAERQIRTNGFITVLNDKGEPVRVENVRDLTSGMVMSLMQKSSDGIDLESLKNALSRTDVVGFLAGEYPKMYFTDEYGAEHWALEAAAELWALRDLGLIYGDDIDAALEWMDDVSDGRYTDIRRRSDADGLREIEARYYENLGPDPELSGNSIAEVRKRLEIEHKKELSEIERWSEDSSTTSDDFIDALAGLEYNREAYNDAFDNLEASGESKDSPAFKNLNRKIKENNAKIALIEKKWSERFSSEDKDRRRSDVKKMRESVREKMFSEGILKPKEMAARSRQEEIKNLKKQADDMTEDEFVQKLADIEISLKEPGLSADDKSVLLEDKKMLRAIFKSKLEGSEDSKVWAKQRRELDTRIDEIVNPPRQQALKKTKKVKTDKAGASYAKKIQRDESLAMTKEQAIAVERLGDPSATDIGNLVDPDGSVAAIKNINRRYRRAQRSAGDLSPESETAALEDQIEKVLIPAMEAIDESSIPDDIEIEAEMYFDVKNGFKMMDTDFDSRGFVTGRIITDESPHKRGEVRDVDGNIITRAGKEKSRVLIQVSKGDKGVFRTNETILGDEGVLVLPPGKMKIVDRRPDGTVVLRVQEQDNVVDVLDRLSAAIGEEGPGASQHAKGTKKKIDRVSNKYVAQRKENGLSSTPSRPKRDVEIEDKNVEVRRQVISAGGSFGEPPSEDYIAEIGKVPLVQPAEADIKNINDMFKARTGKQNTWMTPFEEYTVDELLNLRAAKYRALLDPDFLHESELISNNEYIGPIKVIDKHLAERGEIVTNLPPVPEYDYPYEPGQKQKLPYQTSIVKTPLVQPAEADIKPDPVDPVTGRPIVKTKENMSVDELLNRRARSYRALLEPDFANDRKGFQGTERATLASIDEELEKRGEIVTNLPQPPEFDPDYVPGTKKRSPYKTSAGAVSDPTTGREVLGIPQTREERKVVRATRANMTFEDIKRVMAGESPKDVMNDMSRDSLDSAVADEIARKSPEALIKDVEDAAVEFHAGIDKRPRVRMTENQLTKFADDGEFLPTETDDVVLESGAIGRRLERRLNPATRRSAPTLSSGRKVAGPQQSPLAQASLDKSVERADKARARVDGLEKALDALEKTGEWRGSEFGVILSRGKDEYGRTDIIGLDNFDADVTPRNLTAAEVEEQGLSDFKKEVKKKLSDSKKELKFQEFLARTKKERMEQGILDVEDIPEEEYAILVEEGKELTRRRQAGDFEAFNVGDNQEAVIHVGQAQLDGGVLDPSRTSTAGLGAGSQGDTGALNKMVIRKFNEEFDANEKKISTFEKIMSSLTSGETKFKPRDRQEANAINELLGIPSQYGAKAGEDIDIASLPLRDGMGPLIEGGNRRLSEIKERQSRNSKLAERLKESQDFGFLSAYPASGGVSTQGYYGRNAARDIPEDVAKYYTEAENTARGVYGLAIDVNDQDFYSRWSDQLRGSAYLIVGESDSTIASSLGPSDERQLIGVNKPIFGVSSRLTYQRQPKDYDLASTALMARAIKLKKEGKEITPAAVLASRRGKPLDESSFSSGRLSSGARSKPSKTQRVAGIAGSRATGRVLDAVLKRSGADEDTRERVKYGVNMAGALAAGGPAGFATALAVDVARRAGREIAERGLEEAVQRGRITQNQMDVAMQAVDRVAPNGLPDPVVDKLADAWSIASDFIDERVATDENRQRLDEFGNVMRSEAGELAANAGEVVGAAREKIGKKFKKLKKKKNNEDDNAVNEPDLGDLRARFGSESMPSSTEYDDPFAGFDENDYKPAKTEYDPFEDSAFSSGRRAGRSSDAFRDEYNSRIGISKSTPNSAKPVSGYVVHRSHNEEKKRRVAASGKGNIGSDAIFEIGDNDVVGDGLTALGEIEVILKPEVSNRTAYGRGEALQSAHRPVAMNSNDPDDIADAIMNADGIASSKQNTEAMLHLLGAKMDKNFSSVNASMDENGKMAPVGAIDSSSRAHEPFEAQILGGFKKNEVEGIHYPYTKVAKVAESEDISDVVNDRSLASKLEKLGFTPEEVAYFYSISGGKPLNTASMIKLKEYRAAKKIKEKYEGMGIGYVKFAHPQGINIENPRSYDKTASPTTRVDEILKRSIDAEVEAELKKTLDSIRKSGQLDLMVD